MGRKAKDKYSYLKAIPYSFYSRDLYREVAQKWEGIGMMYLFVMIFLFLLIPASITGIKLHTYITQGTIEDHRDMQLFGTQITVAPIIDFINQFPTIRVESGKVRSEVQQPYYLVFPNNGDSTKPFLILDTTGEVQNLVDSPAEILITENKLITRENDGSEITRMDFAKVQDMVIDRELLLGWLRVQPIIYFPGMVILHFIIYTINSLVFGLLGVGICRFMKLDFAYKANIRLAAVTTTPIILLDVLSAIFSIQIFSNPNVIYLFAHAAYMYHAVESNKK